MCVAKDPHLPRDADVTIDVEENYIMPGTIDPHTHIMELGLCDLDDINN